MNALTYRPQLPPNSSLMRKHPLTKVSDVFKAFLIEPLRKKT